MKQSPAQILAQPAGSSEAELRRKNLGGFPDGFLWGAATAAHQVEGGTRNDWSEWEKKNAQRLAQEAESKFGHLPNWPDIKEQAQDPANYISGAACEHYTRYEADFDIAKSLGHNAHRFSVEWSRIEPEEGKWDENEIEHYRAVIKALRERGMEPFVTLWHWTLPLWVRDMGGWENKKTIDYFIRYAERMVKEYGSLVKFWLPMNEPGVYVGLGYVQGKFPPQKKSIFIANKVFKNVMRGFRAAYAVIHAHRKNASVGISHYAVHMIPYKNLPWNILVVKILDHIRNWRFLDAMKNSCDFIGVQYYHTDVINLSFKKGRWGPIETRNANKWISDLGWDIHPEGIYFLLKRASRYGKPLYITENGIADARDVHRQKFIREHLAQIARAIQDGVDVRGYLHWSLLDNFEWAEGYWPRFGLVEVDYATQKRTVRPSARAYAKIIQDNGIA